MKSGAEREPVADATRRRDSQIGHGAVTLEQIRNRLWDATQDDRIVRENAEGAVEVGRKTATNDDASRRGAGEHERREARTAERGVAGVERGGTPRRPGRDACAHAPDVTQRCVDQRRERIERSKRATGGAGADALPLPRCAKTADAKLRVLGG